MTATTLRASIAVGVVALGVSISTVHLPSIWYDETATRIAVTLTSSMFTEMLGEVDLVHALYYLVLRAWSIVAGTSVTALRIPSALATAVTASLVVALGAHLRSRAVGITAGLVFAALPVTVFMAGDARPRALGCLVVVASALALVIALRGSRGGRAMVAWTAFAALGALAVVVSVHNALVLVGFGLAVVAGAVRRILPWGTVAKWALATAGTMMVAVPFMVTTFGQVQQVSWIERLGVLHAAAHVMVVQWFSTAVPVALLGWFCVAVAVRGAHRARFPAGLRTLLVGWLALPTVVLLLSEFTDHPMYVSRYPSMSAPALALLIALGLSTLRQRWRSWVGILLAIACVLSWVGERFDPPRADWRAAARIITDERADLPGETGIIYGRESERAEDIEQQFPVAVRGLRDLTAEPWNRHGAGWFIRERIPAKKVGERVSGLGSVLYVGDPESDEFIAVRTVLSDAGFAEVSETPFRGGRSRAAVVATFTR